MLYYHKARPKRNKLLTISKDSSSKNLIVILSRIYHDIVYSKFGKVLLKSIPVLSIFALLGIMSYNVGLFDTKLGFSISLVESNDKAYAAETASNDTSSALIIDGGTVPTVSTDVARNQVVYSSHTVQVKATNIDDYQLTITGPTNLTGSTTIGSAGTNVTGSNLPNNTWGYGWDNTSVENANIKYNGFTGKAQTLSGDSVVGDAVDFTKKLVFAVKFDDNAATGHYKAGVTLNLTITPKKVTFDNITTMQQMTADICKNTEIGESATLIDSSGRGDTSYTIRKLADGNCWMVDNLKLNLTSVTLNTTNSDVTSNYTTPTYTNADSSWSNTNTLSQFTTNGKGSTSYNSSYGYYYSYCAATAGTCPSSGEASSSICPKGWKLPASSDFTKLYNTWTTATWTTNSSLNGRWFGAASESAGGAFFPVAGSVDSSGLYSTSTTGVYWSRTANSSDSNRAYPFYFSSSSVGPAGNFNKYGGLPVRCVAYSS